MTTPDTNIAAREDAFSVAQALYWYCAHYHGGQWSPEYRVLSQLQYKPGALERGIDKSDHVSKAIYRDLKNHTLNVADVLAWVEANS